MMQVLAVVLAACVAHPVSGLRRASRRSRLNTSSLAVDCDQLLGLQVRGHDVGKSAAAVCNYWPRRFGDFPIRAASRVTELFQHALDEGGLWDRMKELASDKGRSSDFCWRRSATRDAIFCDKNVDVRCASTTTTTTCFDHYDVWSPANMPGQDRSYEISAEWCQKRCSFVEGCKHFSYWSFDGGCHLQNASAYLDWSVRSTRSGPPSCSQSASLVERGAVERRANWSIPVISRRRRTEVVGGCELFIDGQCYGSCPANYHPGTFRGSFAPVCRTDCAGNSEFPVGCGFGCAKSGWSCASVTMDQVFGVVSTIGEAAGYLTGNPVLSKVVDTAVKLVEFVITTLWTLIRYGKEVWTLYQESEGIVAFLVTLGTYIQEHAEELGRDIDTFRAIFGELADFWASMISEGFKFVEAPLSFVTDMFDQYGETILDSAYGVVAAFVYPKCDDGSED